MITCRKNLKEKCCIATEAHQARGVSILIKDSLNYNIIDTYKDEDGRLIIVNMEIDDNIYTLINIICT